MNRYQQSALALGSDVLLTIVIKNETEAERLFKALWAQVHGFEHRFSRFLADSELSRFNAQAGEEVVVAKEFRELLEVSKEYSKQTDGLYNPFTLPALQQAGYIGSWPTPARHDTNLNYASRKVVNADRLLLDGSIATIPENSALDFGGIGKGYLLDQLAHYLDKQGINDYWLSLGGDIICRGFDLEDKPWKIGIADCENQERTLDFIVNETGDHLAVATSGITKRKGAGWHHIIDPRTGKPADTDIMAITITGDNATAADVYATCLVILGSDAAETFIEDHKIPAALLQVHRANGMHVERYGGLA